MTPQRASTPVGMRLLLGAGAVFPLAGLGIIWWARSTISQSVYVSELGAAGSPTARPFELALLLIALGGILTAAATRGIRSRARLLRAWAPWATVLGASLCFALASQVTCSSGCPVPILDPRATLGDLVHTSAATLGFAAGCWAMLQVSFAVGHPFVARLSAVCSIAVGAVTATGGLLSIFGFATVLGAALEFTGMTVSVGWLALYALSLALAPRAQRDGARTEERVVTTGWGAEQLGAGRLPNEFAADASRSAAAESLPLALPTQMLQAAVPETPSPSVPTVESGPAVASDL